MRDKVKPFCMGMIFTLLLMIGFIIGMLHHTPLTTQHIEPITIISNGINNVEHNIETVIEAFSVKNSEEKI